ncbi:MAG: hypothetical protein JW893_08130 [Candidatus Omnitrophica bacterium]|nr:hypothetical protein [Candidatus Omnitrophota bacterium]
MNQARTKKTAAVATLIYRYPLSPEEEISLRHLKHFLGSYDCFVIMPETISWEPEGFRIIREPEKYFRGLRSYNQRMRTRKFYRYFRNYEYILVYQLDCLVFQDQLPQWCQKGYDYIGAPWVADNSGLRNPCEMVGNGGFSLRKVESFLRVLKRYQSPWNVCKKNLKIFGKILRYEWNRLWKKEGEVVLREGKSGGSSWALKLREFFRRELKSIMHVAVHANPDLRAEDVFWALEAKKWDPHFKIAPVEEAMLFSFDEQPGYWYEKNGRKLPFGCHGWYRQDRGFWEGYVIKDKRDG